MSTTTIPAIDSLISNAQANGAKVGLHAILPDGTVIGHREHEVFVSASTIKIAIMVELYRQIDAGELSLNDSYVLIDEDKARGSGIMEEMHTGMEFNLRDVLYLMMSISDNTATNVLIDLLGLDAINATMRDIGMNQSALRRPMHGGPARQGEGENDATPAEFTLLINAILDGTAASAESCMAMLEMLKLQSNSRRIGRFVPDGWEWGSKTGSHIHTVNDVGFIMTDDGPLVVSVFLEQMPDVVEGELLISALVREVIALV